MDDINIPLVAVIVAFFGVLLACVTIVSLQAWFYNRESAERQRQTLAQDDPATELGALWAKQRRELDDPPGLARSLVTASAPATGTSQPTTQPHRRIPIDEAMAIVAKGNAKARPGRGRRQIMGMAMRGFGKARLHGFWR